MEAKRKSCELVLPDVTARAKPVCVCVCGMSVSKGLREEKTEREKVMRSAELTDKVIAFSRTLRLRGKKEGRKK